MAETAERPASEWLSLSILKKEKKYIFSFISCDNLALWCENDIIIIKLKLRKPSHFTKLADLLLSTTVWS